MTKDTLLTERGFVYDEKAGLWRNGLARKAISKEAVAEFAAEKISAWIDRSYPEGRQWDVMLHAGSQAQAENIAAGLGWK